jgi:hypothetical protein
MPVADLQVIQRGKADIKAGRTDVGQSTFPVKIRRRKVWKKGVGRKAEIFRHSLVAAVNGGSEWFCGDRVGAFASLLAIDCAAVSFPGGASACRAYCD